METNLTSFYQALKDNFKGIDNKATEKDKQKIKTGELT